MDAYAAEKIATRKFIEHIGQELPRQNTKNMTSSSETIGNIFKITWKMDDVNADEVLTTGDEKNETQFVSITVDMENGEVQVVEDTTTE